MPDNVRFPPAVEIKRAIAAAIRAGIEIGSIEIYADRITIHPRNPSDEEAPRLGAYDLWKLSEGKQTDLARRVGRESDAPATKSTR